MKTKGKLKQALSWLLAVAMLVTLLPALPVSAVETNEYDAVFLSDLHNGVGGYQGLIQMMDELKNEGQNPRVLSHGGDYVEDDKGGQVDWQTQVYDVISGTEKAAFPNAKQVYTMGNHDFETGTFGGRTDKEAAFEEMFGFPRCGMTYADDEMEIYMIGSQCATGSGGGNEAFELEDIAAFDSYLESRVGCGKVIFLQTHWPGHSSFNWRQRVTANADLMIDTINKYGDELDIVWVWGHNHYEDTMRHVILQPGDQLLYSADTSGSTWNNPRNPKYKEIKFTYANAGCMNDIHNLPSSAGPPTYRGPSACLSVAVDPENITFTYDRIQQVDGVWTFSHDADIYIQKRSTNLVRPSTVTVPRSHGVVLPPDYTALEAAIEEAEALNLSLYTDASAANVTTALDAAREALTAERQSAVNAAEAALRSAIAALKLKPVPLSATFVRADRIETGKSYVIVADGQYAMTNEAVPAKESYSGLTETRGAASVQIEDGRITGDVYSNMLWTFGPPAGADAAYDGMRQYYLTDCDGQYLCRGSMGSNNAGLNLTADVGATKRYYTWSFKPYADADAEFAMYANSERAYGNDYAGRVGGDATGFDIPSGLTQRSAEDPFAFMNDGVCSHITLYVDSEDAPVPLDFTALNAAIAEAGAVDTSLYLSATVRAMEAALADAEAALQAETQAEINAAADALNTAIGALVEKPVLDFSALDAAIAQAEAVDTSLYTSATVAALQAALADARAARLDAELQEEVDSAAAALNAAYAALEERPPLNYAGLEAAIAAAEAVDTRLYTAASVRNMQTALSNARTVLDTADDQETIDNAANALNNAVAALVSFNFTALDDAIAAAEAVDTSLYTDETVAAMHTALANAVSARFSGSQATINNAASALNQAIQALRLKPVPAAGVFVKRDQIEVGKTYVIVADGQYAMTNADVPAKETYADYKVTRGSVPVTITGSFITSVVDTSMLWTFTDAGAGYDRERQYYLTDWEGHFLRRGSMGRSNAALVLTGSVNSTRRYFTWSFREYADSDAEFAMYCNTERAYNYDYPGRVQGNGAGFDIPSPLSLRNSSNPFAFMSDAKCSHVTLYEQCCMEGHTYEAVVTAPTCTEDGYTTMTCAVCGDSYTTDETAALGHDYIDHDAQAPTCTEIGWNAYQTCSRCDYTTYEEIPATGHTPLEPVTENGLVPTCENQGRYDTVVYCEVCGEELSRVTTYVDALGHDYEAVVTEPTCEEDGYTTFTCLYCGDTYTGDVTPALGHDFKEDVVDPTCTGTGLVTYTCRRCGEETYEVLPPTGHTPLEPVIENGLVPTCEYPGRYDNVVYCAVCHEELSRVTTYVDALGHDYEAVVKEPTCTEGGYTTFTCSRCEDSYVGNETAALGHDYKEVVKEPTCTEGGYTTFTCSRCEDSYVGDETAALGHDYKEVVKEPTCTEGGYTTWTCTRCGDSYTTDETDALGHDYVYQDAQAPTCTGIGWDAYRTCTRCGDTNYKELPATGHTPQDPVVEGSLTPTCTVPGSYDTVVCCDVCGDELSRETTIIPALGHDYKTEVTAPTCTEDGFTTYTCTRCEDTYTDNVTPALGHDFKEDVVDPTCTEEGRITYTCERCGYTTYEVLPATGHIGGEPVRKNAVAPTCTVPGSYDEVVYCTACNEELSRTHKVEEALGHDYKTEVTAPTCTEDGFTTYTCTRCNDSYTGDVTPALGHDFKEDVVDPTCEEDGRITYTCRRCDYTTYEVLPATGHTPRDPVVEGSLTPTCTVPGSYDTVVCCDVCGEELSRETTIIPALGHDYASVVTEPTCTEDGYTTYTCTRCEDTYTDNVTPALGHDYKTDVAEPTCTEDGYTTYTCTRCNDSYTGDETPALGHDYKTDVAEPTCTEDGYTTYTCTRCEDTYTDNVTPALGHDYKTDVAEPTCTEDGYTTYTCTRCKDSYTGDVTPALGHKPAEAVWENETAPTCTVPGSYDEVIYCAVCDAELHRETKAAEALGHAWDDGTVTLEPTETEPGVKTFTCTRCGETRTEVIPATFASYTVIYDANNGTGVMENQEIATNAYAYLTKNAFTRPGYVFAGWNTAPDGSGTALANSARVRNLSSEPEITLYAQWKPNTYNIKYYGNGGTGSMSIQTATYGVPTTLKANVYTRAGYVYAGWNTKADGSGRAVADGEAVTDLITAGTAYLYAQWTPNNYRIVFEPNGGTGVMEPQTVPYGQYVNLTANTFTRTGYTFAGWNTRANDTGTTYNDKHQVRNLLYSGTLTLYARWKPNTYTVRFYPNGGQGSMANKTMTYGVPTALTANAFTRPGYTFTGWNTAADGSGDAYADKAAVTDLATGGTKLLYAQWEANTYRIVFNANGGKGTMEAMTMTYNLSAKLTANAFTRTGYSFTGWNTAADGTGTAYANGRVVYNLVTKGTVTLYAQWKPHSYFVKFYANGGSGSMSVQTMTYGEYANLTTNAFTRTGYTFAGWNTKIDGSGVTYSNGMSVRNLVSSGTAYLYAQWKPRTYNIKFYANGGTGSMSHQYLTYDVSTPLTKNAFTRAGYTFAGWNTKPDGSGTAYADGKTVRNLATSGTVYLYAQWTKN